jgi:poly(3-hydroxybutyrate) depolymerase
MTVQAFERTHDTPYPPREERVASRARWDAFARRLREHLRLSLGLTPSLPDAPLRALRAEAYRADGYRIERFALETLPDFYLTGSLFVPETPADARAPAMLQPHGHFEQGRLNEADVSRAVALARAGVYVLCYDMVGYNDQFQLPHWGAEPLEWRRWGFSRAGLQTWNSLCAFEWLRQQREIDPQRIGCSGISGGGTQTFLLGALEPRLSCAAPVKMVSSIMQGGCICENAPLLRLFAGNPRLRG